MASHIRVDAPLALTTSHAIGSEAEELRAQLTRLSQEWDSVLSGWSGAAAASYAALWEEWHNGAAKLVETLAKSSQLLERAAMSYDEQEATSAASVRSIPVEIGP